MAERSTISQTVQIGVEAVPGTVVPALKKLLAMGITPNPQADIANFRPTGLKFPTVQALGREWAVASLDGQPTFTELVYPLASVLTNVSPTIPGGGTNSRRWTYTPQVSNEDAPVTFTVEHGSDVRADRYANGLVTELTIPFSRNEVTLGGNMLLQQIREGIQRSGNEIQTVTITGGPTGGTFTLTYAGQTTAGIPYNATPAQVQAALRLLSNIAPAGVKATGTALPAGSVAVEFVNQLGGTDVAAMTANSAGLTGGTTPTAVVTQTTAGAPVTSVGLVPILGKQFKVYCDPTSGALGTTKLSRVLNGEMRIQNRYGPVWVVDADNASWVAFVEMEPTVELMLHLAADSEGMQFLTPMRDGSGRFFRVEAIGPTIEAAITHRFRWDMFGMVTSAPNSGDADGLWGAEWTFRANYDATWAKALQVEVTNNVTAL